MIASSRLRLNLTFVAIFAVAIVGALFLQNQPSAAPAPAAPTTGLMVDDIAKLAETENRTKFTTAVDLLRAIPALLVKFIGIAAIVAFLIGAYMYFLSGGREEMTEKGRNQMVTAIIALFIVLATAGLVNFFIGFFASGKIPTK